MYDNLRVNILVSEPFDKSLTSNISDKKAPPLAEVGMQYVTTFTGVKSPFHFMIFGFSIGNHLCRVRLRRVCVVKRASEIIAMNFNTLSIENYY